MRIMLYEALLSTAKDITLDKSISTNSHLCLSSQAKSFDEFKVKIFRAKSCHHCISIRHVLCGSKVSRHSPLTATKDMA